MVSLRTILFATDFSDTADVALQYAKSIAESFGSSVHVLHVLEDPLPGWKPAGHIVGVPKIREWMEEDARAKMSRVLTDAERQQFSAQLDITWGNPFVEIVRYAANHKNDLIVLGTHGHGAVAHLLLGSVAENVVRRAPCPVLTVRNTQHEYLVP